MDYCSSCRRDLNGVFVCPGCGAYAPDIAPPARRQHGAGAATATTRDVWPTGEVADATADASGTDSSSGAEDAAATGAAATGEGRAARRRQLARWKKHRRRAVAATAFALVSGGLTMAALPSARPTTSQTNAGPPPEPVTASPTPQAATAGSSVEQPDTPVAKKPSTRPPGTAERPQNTTVATPSTATTNRQPETAATNQPPATSNATPHTTAVPAPRPAERTGADTTGTPPSAPAPSVEAPAPAPETPPPAPAERPGVVGTVVGLLPGTTTAEPTSPTQVCLIGVCIR
ncbi:hypothetical protein [Streptomyces sp. NPDC002994]|uniref:SCO2400 family protein n=1 Tax=Streptomyces sp. NPDC002994 TaxID=3154441 RepID=UPI0033A022F0